MSCVPADFELTAPSRTQLDILDSASVASVVTKVRPEVIVNCAGFSSVDGCERDPTCANRVNATAVSDLALLCRREAIRLVHVSTAFVFSGRCDHPYRESDTPEPLNAYGRSKLAGELAIAAAMDDYCIVRTSWLYGRGGENFVTAALASMQTRSYAKLVLDQIGAPTWTPSLAGVLWSLAGSRQRGIFHWCDSGSVTRYEFGRAVAQDAFKLGLLTSMPTLYPAMTAEFGSPARRPAFSTLDQTNTESVLGLTASFWRHSLRSMLQEMARPN